MKNKNKGILCILFAAFCFALMNLFIKMAGNLPIYQKAFFRNAVAIFFSAAVLFKEHIPFRCEKKNLLTVLGRSFFGTVGIFCNFYAIDRLAISDASMLNKLSPFFAILFSIFILKEVPKKYQLACVVTALVGMLLIIKPGGENMLSLPALIGACGGAGAGMAYTLVRKATSNGVKAPFIVFFFSTFSCLACLPMCLIHYSPMTVWQLLFLLLAGLSATGGQFGITTAYSYAKASEISIYDYSQVIFAGILGFFVLHEFPDYLSVLGYAVIIGASITMFLLNQKHAIK